MASEWVDISFALAHVDLTGGFAVVRRRGIRSILNTGAGVYRVEWDEPIADADLVGQLTPAGGAPVTISYAFVDATHIDVFTSVGGSPTNAAWVGWFARVTPGA